MQRTGSSPRSGRPFYPPDPAAVTMIMDFAFVAKNNEPLSNEYKALQ